MPRTWQHFLAAADRPASALGLFTAYQLDRVEHIGTVHFPLGLHDARQWLRERGYERHGLAAAKYHPEPHRSVDFGSWRRVPDAHPSFDALRDGVPRIATEYDPVECQYHVHLWPVDETAVEVYSHYEVRGDLHSVGWEWPHETAARCREHYRPEVGETYLRGVTDLQIGESAYERIDMTTADDG